MTRRDPERPGDLLTDAEVGALLGNKGTALKRWRRQGRGPAFIRLTKERGVRYRRADVLAWLETRRHHPHADSQGQATAPADPSPEKGRPCNG